MCVSDVDELVSATFPNLNNPGTSNKARFDNRAILCPLNDQVGERHVNPTE
jgi:hypothetical protein